MTKSGGRMLAAAALLAGIASPAAAGGFKSWTVCGGNSFNTCASVRLDVVGTSVTLSVRNLSGMFGTYGGTVFTAVGLYNVPAGVNAVLTNGGLVNSMSGPTRGSDTPTAWKLANDQQVGGGIRLDLSPTTTNGLKNGIAGNCDPGALPGGANQLYLTPTCGTGGVTNPGMNDGWVVLQFDVNETWDPSNTELLVKGQNGPDGLSTECITGQNCDVVPEPITMALLGSGLLGLGGVGVFRRRRRQTSDPS